VLLLLFFLVSWGTAVHFKLCNDKPAFKAVMARMKFKFKPLFGFSQICANIAFNCAVAFPKNFNQVLSGEIKTCILKQKGWICSNFSCCSGLSVANRNVTPPMGCWLTEYDLISFMINATVVPLCLAAVLLLFVGVAQVNHTIQEKRKKDKILYRRKSHVEVPVSLEQQFVGDELYAMHKTFEAFDQDRDSIISRNELKRVLTSYGHSASDREIRTMLNDAVAQQLNIVDVHDHLGTTAEKKVVPMAPSCDCGNIFAENSIFCRRCGINRPPAVTAVHSMSFTEFCKLLHLDREEGIDSPFTNLVAEVEAKVTYFHGQIFVYIILLLTFLVFISSSTVSSCLDKGILYLKSSCVIFFVCPSDSFPVLQLHLGKY
jgi:hypothetical protein